MKRLFIAMALAASCAAHADAAWWLENDYTFGSNGLRKDSFTIFRKNSRVFTSGFNVSFYKDSVIYPERVYSFRTPLMYSGPRYFLSLKPFIYPVSAYTRSGAYGGKLYLLTSLSEENDESYLRLIFSGALAKQKAFVGTTRREFSQSALEFQAEKSLYGQFFFMASAAGFTKPGAGAADGNLSAPVLDQGELAYLGVFPHLTSIPQWVLTAQAARNMKPEYDSHFYAGYSKISFRRGEHANSLLGGLKLGLSENATLDMAYNAYKQEHASWKDYYKLLLQLFF